MSLLTISEQKSEFPLAIVLVMTLDYDGWLLTMTMALDYGYDDDS